VRSTADIFGLVTEVSGPLEVAQHWERISPAVDVVLPMTYPSHYSEGLYGLPNPNADPYAVIDHALKDALRRNAKLAHPPRIVPWYQDFTLATHPMA
jgi:hypothetical protein